jgi:predicted sugar kinase
MTMKFHVEIVARDNFSPMEAVQVQKIVFEQLNNILASGKVKEHGIYAFERGGFLLVDAGSPEELFAMMAPFQDMMHIKAYPYVSADELSKFTKMYEELLRKKH